MSLGSPVANLIQLRFFSRPGIQELDAKTSRKLVAETGADGDLVTALRATAAEHCGTCLGLHAGKEAVGLGAVATVGLKSTLRHDKKLLRRVEHLLKLLGCCNNL